MKSEVIGAKPMSQRKTIDNLSIILTGLCLEWGLDLDNVRAVITDNGANIVGACKDVFGASKHISCLAHNLNIVVTNALGLYKLPLPILLLKVNNLKEQFKKSRKSSVSSEEARASEELKELQMTEWKKQESECLKLIEELNLKCYSDSRLPEKSETS